MSDLLLMISIGARFDKYYMKAKLVSENIRFERGQDPQRSMGIGKYTPVRKGDRVQISYHHIDGDREKYTVTALDDETSETLKLSPNGKDWHYEVQHEFDFKDDDGGICYARKIDDGEWFVETYNKNDEDDFTPIRLSESISFERGQDPKETLDIGRNKKVRAGDEIEVSYKGKDYIVTAVSDETEDKGQVCVRSGNDWGRCAEYETRTFKEVYVKDKEGKEFKAEASEWWDNEGNTIWPWIISEWEKPVLESVNFERGQDPKAGMNIGKDRLPEEGETIKVYNSFESDYWDAEVTTSYHDEEEGPVVIAVITHVPEYWQEYLQDTLGERYPLRKDDDGDWMIDE